MLRSMTGFGRGRCEVAGPVAEERVVAAEEEEAGLSGDIDVRGVAGEEVLVCGLLGVEGGDEEGGE